MTTQTRPRGRPRLDDRPAIEAAVVMPGAIQDRLAEVTSIDARRISDMLRRQTPAISLFRAFGNEHLVAGWKWLALDTIDQVRRADLDPKSRRDLAITLAISTEKLLLLHGQPTAITLNVNDHRVSVHELAERLTQVARALPSATNVVDAVQVRENTGEAR